MHCTFLIPNYANYLLIKRNIVEKANEFYKVITAKLLQNSNVFFISLIQVNVMFLHIFVFQMDLSFN